MDQYSPDSLPSVELPSPEIQAPTPEVSRPDVYAEQVAAKAVEQAPVSSPIQPTQQQSVPTVPMMSPQTPPADGTNGITVTPEIAEDADLIEKEWVERAKRIVEHTKNDPHQQTKEMSAMKADYLKKRYNKDLKLSE